MGSEQPSRFWVGLGVTMLYPFTQLLAKNQVLGESLPRRGGALIILNHPSYLDPLFDAVLVHRAGRIPCFFAKNSLWRIPILGRALRATHQIPVARGTSTAADSVIAGDKALQADKVVLIYPEGTLTADPAGWPLVARTGAARLALRNNVPVIPIVRWGTKDILNTQQRRFRPFPRKKVITLVGKPIELDSYRNQPITKELLQEVTVLMMNSMNELLGQIRRETPPLITKSN